MLRAQEQAETGKGVGTTRLHSGGGGRLGGASRLEHGGAVLRGQDGQQVVACTAKAGDGTSEPRRQPLKQIEGSTTTAHGYGHAPPNPGASNPAQTLPKGSATCLLLHQGRTQ